MAFAQDTKNAPLQIHVDGWSDDRYYTNNDTVRGTVHLDPHLQPTHVSITFEGLATSNTPKAQSNSGYISHHAHSTLFRYTHILFEQASAPTPTQPSTFPFTFRFPALVQGDPHDPTPLRPNPSFHHLPPSLTFSIRSHPQSVTYTLSARLVYTSTHLSRTRTHTASRDLRFVPSAVGGFAPTYISRTTTMTHRSARLLPEPPGRLRARVVDLLPTAATPEASFAVTTRVPQTIRAGTPIHIALSVEHGERSADVADAPALRLRGVRVALVGITRVRVLDGGFDGKEAMAVEEREEAVLGERRWEEGEGLKLGGEEVAVEELVGLELGREVVPSFKTFGVARGYWWRVVVWVECAGKVFEVGEGKGRERERTEVEVLSWVEGGEGGREEEGEGLPGYEDAVAVRDPFGVVGCP